MLGEIPGPSSIAIAEYVSSNIELAQRMWKDNVNDIGDFLRRNGYNPVLGFRVNNPPAKHKGGSEALYFIDGQRINGGDTVIYVSYLPPNSVTSIHFHNIGTEEYRLQDGEAILNGLELTEDMRPVEPGLIHQVTTGERPALLLLLMKGVKDVPDDKLHTYLDLGKAKELVGKNAFELIASGIQLPLLRLLRSSEATSQ